MPSKSNPTSYNFLSLSLLISCEKNIFPSLPRSQLIKTLTTRAMKKPGLFAASVAAASATALSSSSSSSSSFVCNSNLQFSQQVDIEQKNSNSSSSQRSPSTDKFAPRFDGLRFIETLITAHR